MDAWSYSLDRSPEGKKNPCFDSPKYCLSHLGVGCHWNSYSYIHIPVIAHKLCLNISIAREKVLYTKMDFQTRNVNYTPLLSPRSDVSALTNYAKLLLYLTFERHSSINRCLGVGKTTRQLNISLRERQSCDKHWQRAGGCRFSSLACLGGMQVVAISRSIWAPTGANQQDLESNSPSPRWVDRTHLFPNHKDYLESIVNLNSNKHIIQ